MNTNPVLKSASQIERELGTRHGVIAGLTKQKRVTPIWLPDHKRPKYDEREVYRALGVDYETA